MNTMNSMGAPPGQVGGSMGAGPGPSNFAMGDGPDFSQEPPLLEELGVNFKHIFTKTISVVNPRKEIDPSIMDDTDLAGPLVFCLALGGLLVFSGKLHFGYICGFGAGGCIAMYTILNLMCQQQSIDMQRVFSVMGYGLIPIVVLAAITVFFDLRCV